MTKKGFEIANQVAPYIYIFLLVAVIIYFAKVALNPSVDNWDRTIEDVCNKNGTISDVYYDAELDKCVNTQCLNLLSSASVKEKSICYYGVE